jgi:NADH dehydrogenase FAD-containing subunit
VETARIVVLGAGFGGLELAKHFGASRRARWFGP